MAMSGALLPWPKAAPAWPGTTGVVVVRAPGGVAPERCTPVFMYASLS